MIESYDFGSVMVDGTKFERDLIIFPDRIDRGWRRKEGHELGVGDVRGIVGTKPEVLVVGTGYSGMMRILPETEEYLASVGIELVTAKTKEACKMYNDLSKSKRVVAALHLTC